MVQVVHQHQCYPAKMVNEEWEELRTLPGEIKASIREAFHERDTSSGTASVEVMNRILDEKFAHFATSIKDAMCVEGRVPTVNRTAAAASATHISNSNNTCGLTSPVLASTLKREDVSSRKISVCRTTYCQRGGLSRSMLKEWTLRAKKSRHVTHGVGGGKGYHTVTEESDHLRSFNRTRSSTSFTTMPDDVTMTSR